MSTRVPLPTCEYNHIRRCEIWFWFEFSTITSTFQICTESTAGYPGSASTSRTATLAAFRGACQPVERTGAWVGFGRLPSNAELDIFQVFYTSNSLWNQACDVREY